ncbi:MAG: ABC-type transport auxiliary lipoprotein family protein [Sphingomonadales bacterium]
MTSIRTACRLAAIVLVPALLGACGGLIKLPNDGPAPGLYNLTAPDTIDATGTSALLLIEDPTAANGLDTTLIARRSSPNELQFFADARWAGRPTAMIQNVLVESFERAGQTVTSARGGATAPARYELQVQLRDFQAEYFQGAVTPQVKVRLAVTLVRLGPIGVVGQTVVEAKIGATSPNIGSVVTAFDQAVHDALADTVQWTAGQLAAAR